MVYCVCADGGLADLLKATDRVNDVELGEALSNLRAHLGAVYEGDPKDVTCEAALLSLGYVHGVLSQFGMFTAVQP
jgi:hypothetical protein